MESSRRHCRKAEDSRLNCATGHQGDDTSSVRRIQDTGLEGEGDGGRNSMKRNYYVQSSKVSPRCQGDPLGRALDDI